MTRVTFAFCALLLAAGSCSQAPQQESAGAIDLSAAAGYFREFNELCTEDGGGLWGVSLCGPILLVDPATRIVVGNRSDAEGRLARRSSVHVGALPEEVGIANTAMEWAGVRWTMLMWWSLGGERDARLRLMAHEAFHRVQPELGLTPVGEINAHLDTADGRFWMQLEWDALQSALLREGDARRPAVADALTFRAARRARFSEAAEREIPLEIFEGLAEYTGMRLAGFSDGQVVDAVKRKREEDGGFVRSFAYVTGPLYGFMLDHSSRDWRKRVAPDSDLGELLAERMKLPAPSTDEATRRADAYGGAELRIAEDERERERAARLAAWRALLIDGPVLVVDLNAVTSGTFDPRKVFPFAEHQTVYTIRELIAEWGRLTVDDGAILEDWSTGTGHLSLAGAAEDFSAGEGWTLELNPGWKVSSAARSGDFVVRED